MTSHPFHELNFKAMRISTKQQPVSADLLLKKVEEMANKRNQRNYQVSVDTLALIFQLKPQEVLAIIEELEDTGRLQRHIPTTTTHLKVQMGSVSLI